MNALELKALAYVHLPGCASIPAPLSRASKWLMQQASDM